MAVDRATLIVGHGSRDARANLEFERLVARFAATRGGLEVRHGYIELAAPLFETPLRELAGRCEQVSVVPLFLFAAGHVKDDVARAVASARREFPGVALGASLALGVHPHMTAAASDRLAACLGAATARSRTVLVVVGRGSSDPDANGDLCKMARLIAEGRGFEGVVPCFVGITQPRLPESLEWVARTAPERVIVLPYFLFEGELTARIESQVAHFRAAHPSIEVALAQPLGSHERLFRLVEERAAQAFDEVHRLPCDRCEHRTDAAGGEPAASGGAEDAR